MQLGILETGDVYPDMKAVHGGFPDMFERWLTPHLPGWTYRTWRVLDGEFPSGPEAADAWLITGSRFGVYDPEPWIEPLKSFIREAAAARVPQIGICFGHQIAAEALGGRAVKSPKGWGIGIDRYRIETPDGARDWPMIVSHQDQVVELAPDATLLGGSEHCPLGVIEYAAPVLTTQFHPEFHPSISAALIRLRAGTAIPEDQALRALDSLTTPPQNEAAGAWVAEWLTGKLATP